MTAKKVAAWFPPTRGNGWCREWQPVETIQ